MQPELSHFALHLNLMIANHFRIRWSATFLALFSGFLLAVPSTFADESQAAQAEVSYSKQIEPIFRNNCQGCHQPAKAHGEYVMTDFAHLLKAGESGDAAIVPGKPDESYLMAQIEMIDGQALMPKKGKPLHASEIELIRKWIEQGATNDSPPSATRFNAENPPVYSRPPVITAIDFSPDGKWIASSGFQEVLLIDTASRKTVKRLIGLSERVESICFSPDSKRLAVTGGSPGRLGEVQVWNVESGELLLSHQVTYDTVYGGRFSPDGKLIAFGCSDNTVRAIDSVTGEQRLHQGAHDDWIRACVFNPKGTHVLSAGRDMTVKLTEVATERFIDNVTSITPGALRGGINSLAMHPERDEVLVGGADGTPKVYRIFRQTERRIGDDANLIREFPPTGGRIFGVDVNATGSHFAVVSTLDGQSSVQVYPYDFEGRLTDALKNILKKRVRDRNANEKKQVEEYRKNVSQAVVNFELTEGSLYAVSFSPDGKFVASGGSDGLIRILDVTQSKIIHEFAPVALQSADASKGKKTLELSANHGMTPDPATQPNSEAEKDLLPKAKLKELRIVPNSITLNSMTDYAQVVVTGVYDQGQTVDLTRLSDLASEDKIQVSKAGLVRPLQTGKATIQVKFGDLKQTIPVQVADLSAVHSPDFTQDVNPILSRLGCNSGTCHGAQKGKNGFKLSLRGYDPIEDIRALGDDLSSRRLNTAAPDASLMLLKPIGTVPHEGGVLLSQDSTHYHILREWIAGGAKLNLESKKVARIEISPTKPVVEREGSWQQFRVVAHYPNGSSRDVTHEAFIESGDAEICKSYEGGRVQAIRRGEAPILVRYEGAYAATTVTVMGDREGFAWKAPEIYGPIDQLVSNKWERMKIQPSGVVEDHEFLRRVRLDLTGLPPSVEELREFQKDLRPSILKRMAKVEELIGSKDYVDHWANKWADLLQVNSKFIGREGATAFRDWIRKSIESNQPYDQFARDVLTASGSNKDNPAASYYKILRDPDLMMENTTHLFLAIRFNCNKCHDHPFERWTQDQYYELAAYFAQTGLKADPASGNKKIGGTAVEGAKPLYEEVFDKPTGEMTHVRTNKSVAPAFPYDCNFEAPENATRRQQLAAWITSKDNPYFARSFVNRLWGYMTGTGLIEPLDDIRAGNPPTNPELLDLLTQEFVDSNFDVQHVLRLICNSRTYQLSVGSNEWNSDDKINYSHAKARRLPAEVLYDAVYKVTGAVTAIPGVAPGTRAAALPDVAVSLPDGFLNNLGRPVRESACECERSADLQLGPVMALVSGPTVGKAISDPKCALPKLVADKISEEQLIREIFVRVLSREATAEEVASVLKSAEQIAIDHEQMEKQLAKRETWWKTERDRLEAERQKKLEATKQQIVAREKAIAPARAKMEKDRQAKIAAADKLVKDYHANLSQTAGKYLDDNAKNNNWFPLLPTKLAASNKDKLSVLGDRSIVASGEANKGVYTLTFDTPLTNITGLRLEALPLASIKGGGPGQPENGNFVVTEIEIDSWSQGKAQERKRAKIKSGVADFSQDGFNPNQTFDGKTNDQRGWAVSPRGGIHHWATYQFAEPIQSEEGTTLQIKIHQSHNAPQHCLARFRISITTDAGAIPLGLPEDFAALQRLPKESRNAESLKSLVAFLGKSDAKLIELQGALATAQRPLPPDNELVGLQSKQKLLEIATPDEPKIVQLRADFAESRKQVENRRLTLAQDLTWALINSPAFLFNH